MKSVVLSLAIASSLVGTPTFAQQAAPSAPAAQPLGGATIPGLCLLSREAIFANAAVGKVATTRLQQLAQDAQAEVDAERKPLDTEIQAFQAEAAKLTPAQRTQREQALQPRLQAVQAKTQQRSREIEATREKAMATIASDAQPVIAQVYTQHKCGLLVDRNTVLGGNMTNDITPDVVKGLDAKVTTITFNREALPAQPAPKP
ncbi:MAG: OmpH family outer membrane protein [Candidatus Sphingomonas phytovorans]|nr:OmpH family outer membrane protein [Sphingomonas sp.]WEK02138.1 MAG: OmpH family outer membrane protein [Sphingomonas sp.]